MKELDDAFTQPKTQAELQLAARKRAARTTRPQATGLGTTSTNPVIVMNKIKEDANAFLAAIKEDKTAPVVDQSALFGSSNPDE